MGTCIGGRTEELSVAWAFLAFAAAVAIFHHVPGVSSKAGDWIDLVTPFVVIGAAVVVLRAIGASGWPIAVAIAAGIAYVDGHGIHLAANSVAREPLFGEAASVAHFWDERFGHIEWHLGWLALLAVFAAAEARGAGGQPFTRLLAIAAVALLGFTFFTSTVEGGTWWLTVGGAFLSTAWFALRPRPLLLTIAASLLFGSFLIAVWAIWQGGVPEFSEVGLL